MKSFYTLLVALFMLAACSESAPKPPANGKFYQGDEKGTGIQYTYKNSRKVSEIPMLNQKAHGLSKEYYDDGKVKLEVNFSDGKREGLTTRYYDTGEKYTETPYIQGKKDGIKYQYMKNGEVTFKLPYKDDKAVPGIEEHVEGKLVEQPKIVLTPKGGKLQIQLSDNNTKASFCTITNNGELEEIASQNGVATLTSAKKGTQIRAYYVTKYKNEAAVDATY